ncbi:Down syndrome cell adhesion molecule-like protein Dscam2 isoform X2 [Bactrocera tryoni]|uniref:Down syndrome cell adhesion molecule-like protein Dscam2 isoform X2 n=1 Tax=Bactrocera tryoni TaxID=59916 RepID=UPI001A976190|nr:Down syndrome cell adhesion molecule-like protein Dscam2 isoform X2 [Bactrocera tryoni]
MPNHRRMSNGWTRTIIPSLRYQIFFTCFIQSWRTSQIRTDIPVLVVNQRYEPEVQNPGGFIGSNVLIKCNIPSFVKEYVAVTSWLQEPNFNIYPSLEEDGVRLPMNIRKTC